MVTVVRKDPGLKKLSKVFKDIGGKKIEVGIFEHSVYPDGTPVAYIAAIQEYGYAQGNIPPRPFFRPTIQEKKLEWGRQVAGAVQGAIDGKVDLSAAYEAIGGMAAGDLARTGSRLQLPPLKEATVRARKNKSGKTSKKPLVDTGTLLQSFTHKVK